MTAMLIGGELMEADAPSVAFGSAVASPGATFAERNASPINLQPFAANIEPSASHPLLSSSDHHAAIVDLVTRLLSIRQVEDAKTTAARLISRHVNADFVAIGDSSSPATPCLLGVMAGPRMPAAERRADVEAALGECVLTARPHSTDGMEETSVGESRCLAGFAHRRLLKWLDTTQSIKSVPLLARDGRCSGALMVAWSNARTRVEHEEFLSAASLPLAELFLALQRGAPGKLTQRWEKLKAISTPRRKQIAGVVLVAGLLFGLIPTRYPVLADVTIQPSVRRWIVAPFDAPLEKSHVVPGQSVQVGELLFTVDCEDSLHRLASLRAESDRSTSERSAHLANGRLSDAAIAGWNIKRLHSEMDLISQRLQRAEIRSPITGIILGEDLERLEGAPLKLGQSLAEVARLDRLHASVEIPQDQINRVQQQSELAITIAAIGSLPTVTMSRIHPRAEPNNRGIYVFQGRAELPQETSQVKPGMRGRATIYGDYRPFAWCLFQRLWQRVRNWGQA